VSGGAEEHDEPNRLVRSGSRRLAKPSWLWLAIFGTSVLLFLIRFLIPTPVGQADNRDGPRLMCGALGLKPVVPHGHSPYFGYAYFQYIPGHCGRAPYVTSELVPLALARLLTPVFGLHGRLNLIALGVLMCVIASVAIASLATGLRIRPWAQVMVAAAIWLIVADASFLDIFASPYSEPAAIVGVLLLAAGLLYLGRERRTSLRGLALAATGSFLVVLAKEQYVFLAVPICLTLVLASTSRESGPWLSRFRPAQVKAAVAVAVVLAISAVAYQVWNAHSPYGVRTQPMRTVDTIFEHIITPGDKTKAADLRALGLPATWSKYAGTYYWGPHSVRSDPLYPSYEPKLTDSHMALYFMTRPSRAISVGDEAANEGLRVRVSYLGDYSAYAGHPLGALDDREVVFTWLAQRLPPRLGLLWLAALWLTMGSIGLIALRRRRMPWHREGAVLVLCLTGCAVMGFIPPAYFDGIESARHMAVMNLCLALAFAISVALAGSMIYHRARRGPRRITASAAPSSPELATNRQD
jgi:hypothetical protein